MGATQQEDEPRDRCMDADPVFRAKKDLPEERRCGMAQRWDPKERWFFGLLRKHVSRRATPTIDRATVRSMCYFYQWVYWRTSDPEQDALRGQHDKSQPPLFDLLKELGRLRKRLRDLLGDDALQQPEWLEKAEKVILQNLPRPTMEKKVRVTQKTEPDKPELGARARKDAYGGWARKRKPKASGTSPAEPMGKKPK